MNQLKNKTNIKKDRRSKDVLLSLPIGLMSKDMAYLQITELIVKETAELENTCFLLTHMTRINITPIIKKKTERSD